MGFLKKIFGRKGEAKKETPEVSEEPPLEDSDDLICSQCNRLIHPGQKIKTYAGEKMHMKPCWFKLRKTAKALM